MLLKGNMVDYIRATFLEMLLKTVGAGGRMGVHLQLQCSPHTHILPHSLVKSERSLTRVFRKMVRGDLHKIMTTHYVHKNS